MSSGHQSLGAAMRYGTCRDIAKAIISAGEPITSSEIASQIDGSDSHVRRLCREESWFRVANGEHVRGSTYRVYWILTEQGVEEFANDVAAWLD